MTEKPIWDELFRTAVLRGDVELLRAAIAAGMPLNETWVYGSNTPLHYAAERGAPQALVKALIDAGADVNVRVPELCPKSGKIPSDAGHTALMLAADKGRTALVRLLLAAGADVDVADRLGSTAISQAAMGGGTKSHTAVVRLLLDAGAKPDAQSLQYAAWMGNPDIVQLILDAGVGPNEQARLGLPLVWAFANRGRERNAEPLLRAGADPDLVATTGQFAGLSARRMAAGKKAAEAVLAAAAAKARGG
jgi:ankyrin repeat protein